MGKRAGSRRAQHSHLAQALSVTLGEHGELQVHIQQLRGDHGRTRLRIQRDRTRFHEVGSAQGIMRATRTLPSWRAAGGMFGGWRRPRQGLRSQPCVARRAWGIGAASLAGKGKANLASDARCHAK